MIIAVINAKGGVGKSTIAVHNCEWLRMYGYKCILVDCDANQTSSSFLESVRPDSPTIQVDDPNDALSKLPALAEEYDAVVVDAPGGLHDITGAILAVTDAVLIPTGASHFDLAGLDWTVQTIRAAQELRKGMPMTAIVPTKIMSGTKVAKNLERFAASIHFGITQTVLHNRTIVQLATGSYNKEAMEWDVPPQMVWDMGKNRQVRSAALELDCLFQEVFMSVCQKDKEVVRRLVTPTHQLKKQKENKEEHDERSVGHF